MKKLTITLSLLIAAIATSCNKSTEVNSGQSKDPNTAYISMSISAPSINTRATEGGKVEGSGEENGVTKVTLLTFDEHYNFINYYDNGTVNTVNNKPVYNCEIAPSSHFFFAIVNPTTEISKLVAQFSGSGVVTTNMLEVLQIDAAKASKDNNFTMVNSGVKGNALVEYTGEGSLSTDPTDPSDIDVSVDRIVSRFEYTVAPNLTVENGTGSVVGTKLNATNKNTYLYSDILRDDLTGGNVYRKDPNMELGKDPEDAEQLAKDLDQLNWLKNDQDEDKFYATDKKEYVLENTSNNNYYNYNNLTQAVVKAIYTPTAAGVKDGESWFAINVTGVGTVMMDFDGVVAFYNDETTTDETKKKMDAQLNHILGSEGETWASATVDIDRLDGIPNGGYKAATATDYIVQYYQNSINYYDIFISHDKKEEGDTEGQEIGILGRWGMVRNNAYTMNVNKIAKQGLPYIPDPTDPKITDPENPDPKDPEPADKLNAYIDATITVKDWTTWSQETTLE